MITQDIGYDLPSVPRIKCAMSMLVLPGKSGCEESAAASAHCSTAFSGFPLSVLSVGRSFRASSSRNVAGECCAVSLSLSLCLFVVCLLRSL